jgi:hypothetical protein
MMQLIPIANGSRNPSILTQSASIFPTQRQPDRASFISRRRDWLIIAKEKGKTATTLCAKSIA